MFKLPVFKLLINTFVMILSITQLFFNQNTLFTYFVGVLICLFLILYNNFTVDEKDEIRKIDLKKAIVISFFSWFSCVCLSMYIVFNRYLIDKILFFYKKYSNNIKDTYDKLNKIYLGPINYVVINQITYKLNDNIPFKEAMIVPDSGEKIYHGKIIVFKENSLILHLADKVDNYSSYIKEYSYEEIKNLAM